MRALVREFKRTPWLMFWVTLEVLLTVLILAGMWCMLGPAGYPVWMLIANILLTLGWVGFLVCLYGLLVK